MATVDDKTYGFSKLDASELVQLIGSSDVEYLEGKVRQNGGSSGSFVEEVRWVDPVLEYRIGATWYTIDTAENCAATSPFVAGLGI